MTSSYPFAWPALDLCGMPPPETLSFERGVWGKAPGAESDYRWLAATPGFDVGTETPERHLTLGVEDKPRRSTLWLSRRDDIWAGVVYRSRVRDAAGRSGFIEKQVARWECDPTVPPLLVMLLLLPKVEKWTADVWLNGAHAGSWSDSRFRIVLPPDTTPSLQVSEQTVAESIGRGLQSLTERLGVTTLIRTYGALLAPEVPRKPAILGGLEEPLRPLEMAALLLPLERQLASRLSVAGWVSSSRWDPQDLAETWDLLATDMPDRKDRARHDPATKRGAELLVDALLERDPSYLRPRRSVSPPSVQRAVPSVPEATPATPKAPTEGTSHDLGASQKPADLRPGARIAISPPPSGAPRVIHHLFDFARDPNRRWIEPHDLTFPNGLPPSRLNHHDPGASLLWQWPLQLKDQRPEGADPEQWSVKIALLRSAALALAPVAAATSWPLADARAEGSSRVPPLLFAAHYDRRDLAELGEHELAQLYDKGRGPLTLPRRLKIVEDWWGRARREPGARSPSRTS